MGTKKKFIPYDRFKIIILFLLLVILAIMVHARDPEFQPGQTVPELTFSTLENQLPTPVKDDKELPAIPSAHRDLFLNADETGLVDQMGNLIFVPGEDDTKWVPVIPSEVLRKLPAGYSLVQDESDIWQLINLSGEALFIFDHDDLGWEAVEIREPLVQAAPEIEDGLLTCSSAIPTRIQAVGQILRVVNAEIPLRLTPNALAENFIISLAQGTLLHVVGEPVCTSYLDGANLWWPVRTLDGQEGFAAEGSAISDRYYLEPAN